MRIEMTRASESRTARTREQRPNGIMDDGPSEPVQTNSEVTQPSRTTTSSSYAICMDGIPPAVTSVHNMLEKQKVWLVGSSILKHAQLEAFLRPGGLHLNLKRLNISLWWQGYSGLKLSQVEQKLKTLAKVGPAPNVILIHCGGNDLGETSIRKLRLVCMKLFQFIQTNFPHSKVIWSCIQWRYSQNSRAMESQRKRLNSCASRLALRYDGAIIRHPDIKRDSLFFCDGVHLSKLANAVFLNTLQGGLEAILTKGHACYPA